MTGTSPDALTTATACVVAGFALLITFGSAGVVCHYARALRAAPRTQGLLLWHVILVAAGTSLVWMMLLLGQLSILGWVSTLLWARLIGYALAGLITCTSLLLIGRLQNRRVQTSTTETKTTTRRVTIDDQADPAATTREAGACPCPATGRPATPDGSPAPVSSEASP